MLEKVRIPQNEAIAQMEILAKHYGADRIIWRYDPIIIWQEGQISETNYQKENFIYLCRRFSELDIKRCYISHVTNYRKFRQRLKKKHPQIRLLDRNNRFFSQILNEMREIAFSFRITLYTCCNDSLVGFNTQKGQCISGPLLNKLAGNKTVSEAKAATRKECGCTRSIDIGDYQMQPCHYGCIYCYANPVWDRS